MRAALGPSGGAGQWTWLILTKSAGQAESGRSKQQAVHCPVFPRAPAGPAARHPPYAAIQPGIIPEKQGLRLSRPPANALQTMKDLTQMFQELPWSGLIPVILVVLMGLLLWAGGRKALRAGFAIIGLLVGGLCGLVLGDSIDTGFSPWIVAGVLGGVTALIAALA